MGVQVEVDVEVEVDEGDEGGKVQGRVSAFFLSGYLSAVVAFEGCE